MPTDIIVPPLSQTSDTLVLTAWLKQVGDRVTKGEALFEVETDKATLEVEAPATGILTARLAEPGAEVAVRSIIGAIAASAAAPAPEPAATVAPSQPNSPARSPAPALTSPHQPASPSRSRLFASPRARRLADEAGLTLDTLTPTGPRGMIVERDVKAALAHRAAQPTPPITASSLINDVGIDAQSLPNALTRSQAHALTREETPTRPRPPAPTPPSRRVALTPTRRTIARRLQAAAQETAPVTLTRDVDATELVALRERLLADWPAETVRPTYTDFLLVIVARVLPQHPHFNATFDGEALEVFDPVHLGLAVDTERGLIVPVLRNVQHQGLLALAQARQALVTRAVAGQSPPDELSGGTFTLTNLGGLGIDAFTPMLNPPQVGILGVGRIRPVALPVNGVVVPRQAMFLSLTFDHRAVDGAPAARFLGDLAALLEHPERIWL